MTRTLATAISIAALLSSSAMAQEIMYRGTPSIIDVAPPTPSVTASVRSPVEALPYGAPWSVFLSPSGGKAPYRASIEGLGLPDAVALTTADGGFSIDGRTSGGRYGPYSVRIVDAEGIETVATVPAIEILPSAVELAATAGSTSYRFAKGAPWTVRYVGNGGLAPYAFTVPDGLTAHADPSGLFVDVTGTGTPQVLGISPIAIRDSIGAEGRPSQPVEVRVGNDASLVATVTRGASTRPSGSFGTGIVRVTNAGDLPTDGIVEASTANGFQVSSSTCSAPLGAAQSCQFEYTYLAPNPSAQRNGTQTGQMTFGSSSGLVPIEIRSSVAGFDPQIVSSSYRNETVSILDGSEQGPWHTFTISNSGANPTGAITVSQSNPNAFVLGSGTCISGRTVLAGGATCTILIARRSQEPGTQSSNVTVSSPSGGSFDLFVSGHIAYGSNGLVSTPGFNPNVIAFKRSTGTTLTYRASGGYPPYRWATTTSIGTVTTSQDTRTFTITVPAGIPAGSLSTYLNMYDRLGANAGFPVNLRAEN